ncbi:potassium channel family protein [Marinigracilibium pacificum]|uniref:Two pore domain potassium channel family protein n=1 Tax=Marinigracilibium pacificum TaxID=2729599 RepID=A0A848J7D3_9BACT|nr:potassium channel family protein [Marinigracilibium pacificum]NMM50344.1 two pore domain potassium channel family protein [Marinigracilibium pacificum]
MNFGKSFGVASFGEDAYRIAKIQSNRIGDFDKSADYYYLEKCFRGYQILPYPYFWNKHEKGIKKFQFFDYLFFQDKAYKNIFPKIMDLIFKYSIGYGEKPSYAIRSLLLLIVGFAFMYMFSGIEVQSKISETKIINYNFYFGNDLFSFSHWIQVFKDFGTSLYFSIVTCTTFGHVEAFPTTLGTKIISSIQMFLGITLFGAWTATLLRKFMK